MATKATHTPNHTGGGYKPGQPKQVKKLVKIAKKLNKDSPIFDYLEKTDGAIVAREDVIQAINKDYGMPETSFSKSFINEFGLFFNKSVLICSLFEYDGPGSIRVEDVATTEDESVLVFSFDII